MGTKRTGGHVVVEAAATAGATAVFALHGVQIDPVFQACADLGVALVDVRHESTAGFAAEGYARVSGALGVAAVCPGPGFTNVLTSIVNARYERTPVLYVVSSPPDSTQESNGLQVGLDHVAMAAPAAKWAVKVHAGEQLARLVAQAIRVATTAPCGPVVLDVPADVLDTAHGDEAAAWAQPSPPAATAADIDRALGAMAGATRPALLVGHTPSAAGRRAIAALVAHTGVPCFSAYGAVGVLADDDPRYGGTAYQLARLAGARPDVLLAVGTSFGFDTPGLRDGGVAWGTSVVQIDADAAEIGRFAPVHLGIVSDPDLALVALAERCQQRSWPPLTEWCALVRSSLATTRETLDRVAARDDGRVHPFAASRVISDVASNTGAVLIGDGAVCKHWLHDALRLPAGASYLTHSRLGCMGMGNGLAIGASHAAPGRPVVCATGDGAAGFALGDFEAIVRHRLPITVVVLNNARWGASQGFQLRDGGPGRAVGTTLSDADYHAVMAVFGGRGVRVGTLEGLRAELSEAVASGEPTCINVGTVDDGVPPEVPLLSS